MVLNFQDRLVVSMSRACSVKEENGGSQHLSRLPIEGLGSQSGATQSVSDLLTFCLPFLPLETVLLSVV